MYYLPFKNKHRKNAGDADADGGNYSYLKNTIDSYRGQHKYVLTDLEINQIFNKNVYREVISSKAFQRLKDIMFLGSIDYVLDLTQNDSIKRHNRYQHSLGVARLALQFSNDKGLTENDERLCVISALLHDIGHAPLSHSLESVFKEQFGISHHDAGEAIIRGDVEIGKDLHATLSKWNINPFQILSIIDGKGGKPFSDIFSHSINIDTIEGILRSCTYIIGNTISHTPAHILDALINITDNSQIVLDEFWRLKNKVYSLLINNKLGVHADYVCQEYMRSNSLDFKKEYYFGYESNLIKNHGRLFDHLKSIGSNRPKYSASATIKCLKRSFFVDKDIILTDINSIDLRYKQKKHPHQFNIKL